MDCTEQNAQNGIVARTNPSPQNPTLTPQRNQHVCCPGRAPPGCADVALLFFRVVLSRRPEARARPVGGCSVGACSEHLEHVLLAAAVLGVASSRGSLGRGLVARLGRRLDGGRGRLVHERVRAALGDLDALEIRLALLG